ncbi:hypothetical protein [Peterkaempfera sp. SMS 1(5)a]|uniref:hypothetical protein n=1 Tax=Peterkaempfera podocarpi TaxID=3232308 RepID=UPI00367352C7
MSLINDAQNVMAAAFLGCSDPAQRLRYAAVALSQAEMLRDPVHAEQQRRELRDLRNDLLNVRGHLSPNGEPRRVPMDISERVAPAVEWLVAEVDRMRTALIAADKELQQAALGSVWRAEHEGIPLGTYRTKAAARDHCEQSMRQVEPSVTLTWVPDFSGDDSPEDLCFVAVEDVLCTGYVVVPVEIQDSYDPDADE